MKIINSILLIITLALVTSCSNNMKPEDFKNTKPSLLIEEYFDGFALKFFSVVRLTKTLWNNLKKNKGWIVIINGAMAHTPDPNFMVGGSVNAALQNFSKALSKKGTLEGVNVNKKHQKPQGQTMQGGVIDKSMPINVSNVALVVKKKSGRVGYKFDKSGKKYRILAQTGDEV